MKILLINPPGWQKGSTNLGLCYLAGNLLANGHNVLIFDINATDEPYEVTAIKTKKYAPDIIGFSVKTSTANRAFLISREIKKLYSNATHVAGGPHVTLDYESSLRENPDIEYCFLGEADKSFIDFVNCLTEQKSIRNIPGIAYVENANIVVLERKYIKNLDTLPYPSFETIENFDFKDFRYPIITSRGCPYQCTYCCVGLVCGKIWRARTPENTIAELEFVKEKFGIKTFEILDDNFTFNLDRAKNFCRLIIKNKLKLNWYCHNGIRADKIDLELAKLMKKAGCTSIALGIESGNTDVFNSIKKGESLQSIISAVKYIKTAGIRVVGYFIIGLPGDSINGIKQTVEFQQKLNLDDYNYGILNPYPHTEVYDVIKRNGKILMDIKESSHFSSDLTIPFEMPGFPQKDMENAYYFCKLQKLQKVLDEYQKISHKNPIKILYIDFTSSSKFTINLARLSNSYVLDVLCSLWQGNNYFKNKAIQRINNLRAFEYSSYFFKNLKNVFKLFKTYRKSNYDIIFHNIREQRKLIPLAILIIRPQLFYLEFEDGYKIVSIKDKEVRDFIFKESRKIIIKLPKFALCILTIPIIRLVYIIFGLFLYCKRHAQVIELSSQENPVTKDRIKYSDRSS